MNRYMTNNSKSNTKIDKKFHGIYLGTKANLAVVDSLLLLVDGIN